MKKLIASATILLALLCSCSPAVAQEYFTKKPVICGPIDKMINKYSNDIGENPLLSADGLTLLDNGTFSAAPSRYIFGFNKETGTWTLLEFLPDGVQACVIGKGIGMQLITQEQQGINL